MRTGPDFTKDRKSAFEETVTLAFNERIRVLAARFEGVDRKWLCTEFEIL